MAELLNSAGNLNKVGNNFFKLEVINFLMNLSICILVLVILVQCVNKISKEISIYINK